MVDFKPRAVDTAARLDDKVASYRSDSGRSKWNPWTSLRDATGRLLNKLGLEPKQLWVNIVGGVIAAALFAVLVAGGAALVNGISGGTAHRRQKPTPTHPSTTPTTTTHASHTPIKQEPQTHSAIPFGGGSISIDDGRSGDFFNNSLTVSIDGINYLAQPESVERMTFNVSAQTCSVTGPLKDGDAVRVDLGDIVYRVIIAGLPSDYAEVFAYSMTAPGHPRRKRAAERADRLLRQALEVSAATDVAVG
jgi:hypothetical protein